MRVTATDAYRRYLELFAFMYVGHDREPAKMAEPGEMLLG